MGVWCFALTKKTLNVSLTGSDVLNDGLFAPLATIQVAVRYANDGDTILLAPGTYKGGSDCSTIEGDFHGASKRKCNYNIDYMGKEITIDGGGHATIDCEAESYGPMPKRGFIFANGETSASILQGVTIAHCRSATSTNGIMYSNRGAYGAGIFFDSGVSAQIFNTIVLDCDAKYGGGGAYIYGAAAVHFRNVSFYRCSAGRGGALALEGKSETYRPSLSWVRGASKKLFRNQW